MGSAEGSQTKLPKFDRPPVVEVAVGVEFVPMPGLGVVELVRLHGLWEQRYPKVQEQPPMPPSPPVGHTALAGIGINIGPAATRLWMLTNDDHRLVQVQNDRLILNWRRLEGEDDPYPSYDVLRQEFEALWQDFQGAVATLGVLRPATAEVTFVNSMPAGSRPNDLGDILTGVRAPSLPGELTSTRLQWVTNVTCPQGRPGQLVVTAEAPSSGADRVGLTLVTRIALPGGQLGLSEIMESLDFAHETGVLGFTTVTTSAMHELWERRE